MHSATPISRRTCPRRSRPCRSALVALVLALAIGACGGGGDAVTPPSTVNDALRVEVAPATIALHLADQTALKASVRSSSGAIVTDAGVTWESSTPAIARVAADGTVTATAPGSATITATVVGRSGTTGTATITVDAQYDLAAHALPRVVTSDYIALAAIQRVSRFRSGVGHDYSDSVERCRSMKHYFQPYSNVDWRAIPVRAPFDGVVTVLRSEQTFGTQLHLQSRVLPAITAIIFHVNPAPGVAVGQSVPSGGPLGTHIGNATMSDVAIEVATPSGRRLVSYFDAMTDEVFQAYRARGVTQRPDVVIGAAERDSQPLQCNGEAFLDAGAIENWVGLR